MFIMVAFEPIVDADFEGRWLLPYLLILTMRALVLVAVLTVGWHPV